MKLDLEFRRVNCWTRFEYFKSIFYGFFSTIRKKNQFSSTNKFRQITLPLKRCLFFLRIRFVNKYSLENDQYFSKSFLFDEVNWTDRLIVHWSKRINFSPLIWRRWETCHRPKTQTHTDTLGMELNGVISLPRWIIGGEKKLIIVLNETDVHKSLPNDVHRHLSSLIEHCS